MSFNEYDLYMFVGNHTNTCQETESVYNKVKRDWAKMFTSLSLTARNPRPQEESVSAAVILNRRKCLWCTVRLT